MSFSFVNSGDASTTDYRVFFKRDGKFLSGMHDIPIRASEGEDIFNMIVEIPRGTNYKFEIAPSLYLNPIKQDVKNGKLRVVDDVFPYTGYIWNYGALPQSWENPHHVHAETGFAGDNDPLDICEIGQALGVRGQIKRVKVLGCMALIDEGETDWKIFAIDVNDPRADEFNDIEDIERLLPGFTFATYEWFRTYKIPTGKPPNKFAFNGEAKNKAYALAVIAENHGYWKDLIDKKIPNKTEKYTVDCSNFTLNNEFTVEYSEPELKEYTAVDQHLKRVEDPNPVKNHVEELQRGSPHGTAELSTIIAALATASAKAAEGGANAIVETLSAAPLAAVYSSTTDAPLSKESKGQYTVYFHAANGVVVYGVYHAATPHITPFSEFDNVKAAGYTLVAAAFAAHGKFTYTTRHGLYSFGPGGIAAEVPTTLPTVESDHFLAVKAPLAFFH